MTQINPPFDGSTACPMCQYEVRGIAAYMHNTFMRWGTGRMFVKLNDLRSSHPSAPILTVPHPATEAMAELHRDLLAALEGMKDEGSKITWTPECEDRVLALHDRFQSVLVALEPLSDAHNVDERHWHGGVNVIRERRGSRGDLYGTGQGSTSYDYTVEIVGEGADLTHAVCGTGLRLHEHFKANIAADPAFYGKVWCPTCRHDVPFAQFKQSETVA